MWHCIQNFRKQLMQSVKYYVLHTGNLFPGFEKLFKYKSYKMLGVLRLTNASK